MLSLVVINIQVLPGEASLLKFIRHFSEKELHLKKRIWGANSFQLEKTSFWKGLDELESKQEVTKVVYQSVYPVTDNLPESEFKFQ